MDRSSRRKPVRRHPSTISIPSFLRSTLPLSRRPPPIWRRCSTEGYSITKSHPSATSSSRQSAASFNMNGTLHKGVPFPLEMLGDLSVSSDGKLNVHAEKGKALHIPM